MPGEPASWSAIALGAAIMSGLVLYAVLAGADFGGGVWHLFAYGRRAHQQRALVVSAIAPIWEANHVWLILVVVVLFTGFPPAFAALGVRLHAPLLFLLFAIVVRGSAFAFRSASANRPGEQRGWDRLFQAGSIAAPLLIGMSVGALISNRGSGRFVLSIGGAWTSPFAIATGAFALILFSYLAAVYLTVEAHDDRALQDDFRRRALATGVGSGILAVLTFVLSERGAPLVHRGLSAERWSLPFHAVTAFAAITALVSLLRRRFRLARGAAAAQVAFVVLGWGASQYPFILAPDLTLASASASAKTQHLLLAALATGAAVLFPSLWFLFRVFKSPPASTEEPARFRR
jgi:cytochrome bd ubiquinol oxidase subunit II